jgi:uncharacterized Zn finger protein
VIEQGSEWIQFSLKSWTNDKDSYDVSINTETGEATCSCPQFQIRHRVCKHLLRAMAYVQRKAV